MHHNSKWQPLLLALLLLLPLVVQHSQAQMRKCKTGELCTTKKRCEDSDDSGRGLFGPRILHRTCGEGLVCCDIEQLESYDAVNANKDQAVPEQTPSSVTTAGRAKTAVLSTGSSSAPPTYKRCGVQKECVPRFLCDKTVNDNGRYLIMPRLDNNSNFGCKALERCCPIEDHLDVSDNPIANQFKNFQYKGCGYSNPKGLYYDLVGYGFEAGFGEFPWMIALISADQNKYICGGTLIHPQLVVTSAHNTLKYSADKLVARAGEWDMNGMQEPHPHQTRNIQRIITHEQFNGLTFANDIALLVLDVPFMLESHVQPLCLPPVETPKVLADFRAAQCFVIGWGKFNTTSEHEQVILKRIDVPVIESNECQRLLRNNTILGLRYNLHASFLCAGGEEGKDSCTGDGGSPLFCSMPGEEQRYWLAGIVSWGIQCAEKDIPAGYTNVPHLRSWIDEQVKSLSGIAISEP